jgi:sulfate transport system substrate-binding protein
MFARTGLAAAALLAAPALLAAAVAATLPAPAAQAGRRYELLNVSYDPTRELWHALGAKFAETYKTRTGDTVTIRSSHGGSSSQARAVIDGLKADLVTLALAGDIDAIAAKGLIKPAWEGRLPHSGSPYTSTIVFLVRKGNPKQIHNWDNLLKPGIKIITPNPKTSGGARWNFLAAWGQIVRHGGSEAQARDYVARLYANVPVLDTGARGSTTTFVQKGIGDVLIAWENEAILALKEAGPGQFEIIYPETTILAEPPVAAVDATVDAKGTRAVAEALLTWLYTDEAQEIIASHGYRPRSAKVLEKHARDLPPIKTLFTVKDVAGSWAQAQKTFFADGGVFDQLYTASAAAR